MGLDLPRLARDSSLIGSAMAHTLKSLKARIKARRVYVVSCPSCRKPVDFTGEGGIYFGTRKEAEENAPLWIGEAGENLTEICGCTR